MPRYIPTVPRINSAVPNLLISARTAQEKTTALVIALYERCEKCRLLFIEAKIDSYEVPYGHLDGLLEQVSRIDQENARIGCELRKLQPQVDAPTHSLESPLIRKLPTLNIQAGILATTLESIMKHLDIIFEDETRHVREAREYAARAQ